MSEERRAIYFLKLNDMYLYRKSGEKYLNERWVDLFISVVTYVSDGCFSRIYKKSKLILYIVRDTGNIEDHESLPMEFKSYHNIPPDNIFLINYLFDNVEVTKKTPRKEILKFSRQTDHGTYVTKINKVKMDYIIDLLINTYTYLEINGLLDQDFYTHITCSIFFNSIAENGLLVNPPVRIIDYDFDDEETGGRYDLTQEIHSLSDFTDSQEIIIPIIPGNELVEEQYQGPYDEEEELFPQEDQYQGPYDEEEYLFPEEDHHHKQHHQRDEGDFFTGRKFPDYKPNYQPDNFFEWTTTPYVKKKEYPDRGDVLDGYDDEFNDFIDESARMDDDDDGDDFFTSFAHGRGGKKKTYKRKNK